MGTFETGNKLIITHDSRLHDVKEGQEATYIKPLLHPDGLPTGMHYIHCDGRQFPIYQGLFARYIEATPEQIDDLTETPEESEALDSIMIQLQINCSELNHGFNRLAKYIDNHNLPPFTYDEMGK